MEKEGITKIMAMLEEIHGDGGFTAEWLQEFFHGWLESSFCEQANANTRSSYYSYMLELSELLNCINERPRIW